MQKIENTDKVINKARHRYILKELLWQQNDHRGRWLVMEPPIGRLLKGCPSHVRDTVDGIAERRGRRFASLAQARAFARKIGGNVAHWKRHVTERVGSRRVRHTWRVETNPWARAIKLDSGPLLLEGRHSAMSHPLPL